MRTSPPHTGHQPGSSHGSASYRRLAIMAVLSFVAMYALMFAMVDRLTNVIMNLNQVYMAVLMTAPMVLIELAIMKGMYVHARRNVLIVAGAVVTGAVAFVLIRQQTAIGDRAFARSMIPHHASAILMCEQARLRSPEIRALCERPNGIVESQRREIEQLRAYLRAQD